MQNKNSLIALIIGTVIVVGLGWQVLSGFETSRGSGNEAVSLTTNPNPLRTGPATLMIDINDKSGKPVDNATVFFDLNMTSMNMGTQQGNASPQGNGRYAVSGNLSMRGPWRVTTKIIMPDSSVVNKDFTVNVL